MFIAFIDIVLNNCILHTCYLIGNLRKRYCVTFLIKIKLLKYTSAIELMKYRTLYCALVYNVYPFFDWEKQENNILYTICTILI